MFFPLLWLFRFFCCCCCVFISHSSFRIIWMWMREDFSDDISGRVVHDLHLTPSVDAAASSSCVSNSRANEAKEPSIAYFFHYVMSLGKIIFLKSSTSYMMLRLIVFVICKLNGGWNRSDVSYFIACRLCRTASENPQHRTDQNKTKSS